MRWPGVQIPSGKWQLTQSWDETVGRFLSVPCECELLVALLLLFMFIYLFGCTEAQLQLMGWVDLRYVGS